jgi:hypothetical protein
MFVFVDLRGVLRIWCWPVFMIYLHTKFHMHNSNGSFFIAVKLKKEDKLFHDCHVSILNSITGLSNWNLYTFQRYMTMYHFMTIYFVSLVSLPPRNFARLLCSSTMSVLCTPQPDKAVTERTPTLCTRSSVEFQHHVAIQNSCIDCRSSVSGIWSSISGSHVPIYRPGGKQFWLRQFIVFRSLHSIVRTVTQIRLQPVPLTSSPVYLFMITVTFNTYYISGYDSSSCFYRNADLFSFKNTTERCFR